MMAVTMGVTAMIWAMLAFRQPWPVSVLSHCRGHSVSSANLVHNAHGDVIQSVSTVLATSYSSQILI